MESVGSYLKHERHLQNKSLKEVADATRINRSVLEALEEDSYEFLPPSSYVRGFLRIYAAELGLDPDIVIDMYVQKIREKKGQPPKELNGLKPQTGKQYYRYIITGIVICVLLIFYIGYQRRGTDRQVDIAPQTQPSIEVVRQPETHVRVDIPEELAPNKNAVEALPETYERAHTMESAPADVPLDSKAFTVRFVASELTWIELSIDDTPPFDITLRPGESYSKNAQQSMQVRIGNAGGLELYFNDSPLGVPGDHGEPLDLLFPEAAAELQDLAQ